MLHVPRTRWAVLAPTRWAWLRLLTTPSSYLLVLALTVTMVAKARVVRGLEGIEFWPGRWFAAVAPDFVVFLGLAAMFALAERASRRALFATLPLAFVIATLACISALQLWITGAQLSAQVLVLGIERFADVQAMARASINLGPVGVALVVIALVVPPGAAGLALRRASKPLHPTADGAERARAASASVVFAVVVFLVAPTPEQFASLYRNAVAHAVWGLAVGAQGRNEGLGLFAGYQPHDLVESTSIATLRAGPRPNIVLIVLESTRRDATSLAGPQARAKTPNLVALAARGIEVTRGRAVIPHTTKSLWSMLCGRLPILVSRLYETTPSTDVQCIPHILHAAGWRTGFLQSAVGRFEDRPRLARRLGFREFLAAENYTKSLAGYLATDDEALVEQLRNWFDKSPASPFMVTLLTSSTHHPYLLTDTSAARANADGAPTTTDRDRYDRQVEAADHMIGGVLDLLRQRGVFEQTIVVVVGDHGEGFGEKVTRQHALNFYEEGLRVPWVIAGPGVPQFRSDANASLLDLAPTLLDLLGVELSTEAASATYARSVMRVVPNRVLPFSCFIEDACDGFVVNSTKVVSMRESGRVFSFDLSADPDERNPLELTLDLARQLEEVQRILDRHRTTTWPRPRDEMLEFWPWNCQRDLPCGIKN